MTALNFRKERERDQSLRSCLLSMWTYANELERQQGEINLEDRHILATYDHRWGRRRMSMIDAEFTIEIEQDHILLQYTWRHTPNWDWETDYFHVPIGIVEACIVETEDSLFEIYSYAALIGYIENKWIDINQRIVDFKYQAKVEAEARETLQERRDYEKFLELKARFEDNKS